MNRMAGTPWIVGIHCLVERAGIESTGSLVKDAENFHTADLIVGVSLLAIAVCQSTFAYMKDRYREQAHSYRGAAVVLYTIFRAGTQQFPNRA
jgi:hypothetical protein